MCVEGYVDFLVVQDLICSKEFKMQIHQEWQGICLRWDCLMIAEYASTMLL